jgi:4-hydroxyacetophenone monooxygenase
MSRRRASVGRRIDLTESDVQAAVAVANVPALLMVVFQMTGDERWLRAPYLPTVGRGLTDHDSGGLPDDIQGEIREEAVRAILGLQRGLRPAIEIPSSALAVRMMSVFMGEPVAEMYGPMLSTELARRVAPDAPENALERVAAPAGFRVIVIGAGVSGIVAAQQLEEMGLDYIILEKQRGPGGNWRQNTYPGAGVDTPSHLYSFFFAPNDWEKHFELRDNLQLYFSRVMEEVGGARHVRYGTEVLRAVYHGESCKWDVEVRNPNGSMQTLTANVVVSAVGVLNRLKLPDIPGMASFAGPSFHSSDWPVDINLDGKRVALVGTGASSMQIGCAIAERVSSLTIFQRSPQWVVPFDKFQQPIRDELRMLLRECPLYHGWYWLRLFWQFGDKVIEALRIDPEWPHPERSVNSRNDGHREFFTRYIRKQLEGRADLIEKVLPNYPPYGKRILLDNGWYSMLRRDNVTLIDEPVAEVREHSMVSSSGEEHETHAVIWATGFDVARFVASLDVRGLGGISLRDAWDDDNPRAYMGVSSPGFPNFFMLGGPNSFPGSGSFMHFMEVQMRYIRRLMNEMFRHGIAAIEPRQDATDNFNHLIDSLHERMVWTHRGMSTYYRNRHGRVVFVMPFLNVEFWEMTKRADLENYRIHF